MPNISIPATDIGYGVVQTLSKKVTFADNGVAKTLGTLPAGAIVVDAGVVVTTAFNAGTSNTLNIGVTADDDGLATLLALGTIGSITWDERATSNDVYQSADQAATATVVLTGTAATAGVGYVYVNFVVVR